MQLSPAFGLWLLCVRKHFRQAAGRCRSSSTKIEAQVSFIAVILSQEVPIGGSERMKSLNYARNTAGKLDFFEDTGEDLEVLSKNRDA
ncbi:hypothetical protein ABVB72_16215 [Rhizobium nepotum]|uniref:hypothetical protein n=1 Tax=Rhizobium nepotum TaxID=1035271 RepID=UPI003369FE19